MQYHPARAWAGATILATGGLWIRGLAIANLNKRRRPGRRRAGEPRIRVAREQSAGVVRRTGERSREWNSSGRLDLHYVLFFLHDHLVDFLDVLVGGLLDFLERRVAVVFGNGLVFLKCLGLPPRPRNLFLGTICC